MSNAIQKVEQEFRAVTAFENKAVALAIVDDASMATAVTMLSEANKIADRVKEEKEKVTKPLLEALNAERARWNPIENVCASVVEVIRTKMIAYNKKVEADRLKKEEQIVKRVEKGTLRPETAVVRIENLPETAKSVTTDAGMVQWMTVVRLVVEDANAIPREYLDINEARVRAALKAGKVVPGAKLIEEKVPKNLR